MQLTKEQISEFEEFISKIPISKVRADIERMWDYIKNGGYVIKSEQLDQLKDFSIQLSPELQNFAQTFSHWVKNETNTLQKEKENKTPNKSKADLAGAVKDSLKSVKVKNKDIDDNSVSDFDDKENQAAHKQTDAKKEQSADLEKQAKAGDLKRTENKDKKPVKKEEAKVVPKKVVEVKPSKIVEIKPTKSKK